MKQEDTATLTAALRENLPVAVEIRRAIHRRPELAFQEFETAALIRRYLEDWGVELLDSGLPTAVVARIRGSGEGPTILVREDIDALPLEEATGLPFSSEIEGRCHACGHDIHTASLLLLARVMQECRDRLKGTILLAFQPAEERAAGAKAMLAAGFGQGETRYDQVIGFHVAPELTAGEVGLAKGPANASFDIIHITVRGKGGHGAHPYLCADPVVTAAYLITQLQTVISRENPALQPAVLTIGSIHGGTAENIIPTQVEMGGTLRAFHEDGRHRMWESIRRITSQCCAAMGAEGEVEIREGLPVLDNDPRICDGISAAAARILGADHVHTVPATPGSDDFSCFQTLAPGVQFRVGTGNSAPKSRFGIHNPQNLFDEESIYAGAAVMCQYLLEVLSP